MATYNRLSHFNDKYLRKLCGSAIYAELAIAYGGIWNRTRLEEIIDGKDYYDCSGRYRRMCDGKVPYHVTCSKIQNKSDVLLNHKCEILKWREHPLWRLLYIVQPTLEDIKTTLLTIGGKTKNYIWNVFPEEEQFEYLFARKKHTKELIQSVGQLNNIEALILLTAWAREAQGYKKHHIHYYCTKYSREIFAHVVCTNPQLFIRWPILYQYYIEPVWYLYSNSDYKALKIYEVEDEIYEEEKTARTQGIQLPPKNIFREVNKLDKKMCL